MNIFEPVKPGSREAKLRYLDADYQVLREGEFVRCAVSGDPIVLENLRYWSVSRQEAYGSAEVAFRTYLKLSGLTGRETG